MRIRLAALWFAATMAGALAAPSSPPFEVTRNHVDIEVSADGSYVETREERYRVLDERGIDVLHERKLAYTQGFESLQIVSAYTLKADGRRIDVPRSGFLSGFGQSSKPGFQDSHVISVFYPNLEVGDTVVLVTLHRQLTPWFAGYFDFRAVFSRTVASHDVRYAITAPASMTLKLDAMGVDGGAEQSEGDKKHWVWEFHNDTPVTLENDAVAESDFSPHLIVTSFPDYAAVARAYRDRASPAATVTPEIQALADKLTAGVTDQRQQAKLLYDWVSSHIAYVAIELGAGGFTPHQAKDVLANRFGDCKDHVVLLETLLKAKGIDSSAVLINAGARAYKLPEAATPHSFDHVITYLPAFHLYVDSTAQLAPFGILPYADTGKPVVLVATGEVARTPTPTSAMSGIRTETEVTLTDDGNANGKTTITSRGAYGVGMRALIRSIPSGKEDQFFRTLLGPGAQGTLDRGDPQSLTEPYVASASFSVPGAFAVPGPGALPFSLSFKPFYFTQLVAGNLPAVRNSDYVCMSLSAEENTKITLPAGYKLLSIPDTRTLTADGIQLKAEYDRPGPRRLDEVISLKIDHPTDSCTPEYYARVHASLTKMTNMLREQILYRGPRENER